MPDPDDHPLLLLCAAKPDPDDHTPLPLPPFSPAPPAAPSAPAAHPPRPVLPALFLSPSPGEDENERACVAATRRVFRL
ncbi:hypothetical protein HaLaN_27941 [Haematococcus lacustris]|uniref:Uncharacterized protein n=1 Tax=Haematococcus lacustris TaxID=44745 RepID=A0A6A0AA72_HAELA|nr:hypothetical protein HaLaN_27941 [Haematococcus lacustris]